MKYCKNESEGGVDCGVSQTLRSYIRVVAVQWRNSTTSDVCRSILPPKNADVKLSIDLLAGECDANHEGGGRQLRYKYKYIYI